LAALAADTRSNSVFLYSSGGFVTVGGVKLPFLVFKDDADAAQQSQQGAEVVESVGEAVAAQGERVELEAVGQQDVGAGTAVASVQERAVKADGSRYDTDTFRSESDN